MPIPSHPHSYTPEQTPSNFLTDNSDNSLHHQISVITTTRKHNNLPRKCVSRTLIKVSISPLKQSHAFQQPSHGLESLDSFAPPPIYLINATSIAKPHAITHLHADLIVNNIGIAIITETWLKSHHANSQFALPGYSLFRRDRLKRRGGGVAIYVRTTLHATILELEEPYNRNLELLWLRVTVEGHVFIVAAVDHPPKLIYQESELISAIERSLELFVTPDITFVTLAGDFNQLSNETILLLGLMAEFNEPPRAGHCLDRLYSAEPTYTNCRAVQSTISTAHKAIVARADAIRICNMSKTSKTHTFRNRSLAQHAQLLRVLSEVTWEELYNAPDVQTAFDLYHEILLKLYDTVYPLKTITLSNCYPKFITPHIKSLLRLRNRLMRRGRSQGADSITAQINRRITRTNAAKLSSVGRGGKEVWQAVSTPITLSSSQTSLPLGLQVQPLGH